jgi:Rrf2 family protein
VEDKSLKIRKELEYALMALLAMGDIQRVVSSRELSERFNIPLNLLRKIFHQLNRRGLIEAIRGPKGGFLLRSDLSEMTLREVVEALSGPVGVVPCMQSEPCDQEERCNIRHNFNALQGLMNDFLASLTVEQFGRLEYDRNLGRTPGGGDVQGIDRKCRWKAHVENLNPTRKEMGYGLLSGRSEGG